MGQLQRITIKLKIDVSPFGVNRYQRWSTLGNPEAQKLGVRRSLVQIQSPRLTEPLVNQGVLLLLAARGVSWHDSRWNKSGTFPRRNEP